MQAIGLRQSTVVRSRNNALKALRAVTLATGLLSLTVLANAATVSVSPSQSTGNYIVTWSGGGSEAWLRELRPNGTWTPVSGGSSGSWQAINRASGTYSYQVVDYVPGQECIYYPVTFCWDVVVEVYSPSASVTVNSPYPDFPGPIDGPPIDTDGTFLLSWETVSNANRYVLQRRVNSGGWSSVYDGSATFRQESALAQGSYEYRAKACDGGYCSDWGYVFSLEVVPSPDTYSEQLAYEYEIRTGDFDGDGDIDILVERTTPGAIDGSMQTAVIEATPTGLQAVVPTPSELAVARTYPIDTDITAGGTDRNFDGYADIILIGLEALNSPSYPVDCLILYASGRHGTATPAGVRLIDDEYMRFFADFVQSIVDPAYFLNNFNVTTRPRFELVVDCGYRFGFGTWRSLWDCNFRILFVGYDVQIAGPSYHPDTPAARSAFQRISNDDYSGNNPWRELSDLMKGVIGVDSFGFQSDGSRIEVNMEGDGATEAEKREGVWQRFVYGLQEIIDDVGLNPGGGDPNTWKRHDFDFDTIICDTVFGTSVDLKPITGHLGTTNTGTIPAAVCTLENVYCWQKRNPAPRQNDSEATIQPDEPSLLDGNNPIRTHVYDADRVIVNETLGDTNPFEVSAHILHDPLQLPDCAANPDYNVINGPNGDSRCSYVHRQTKAVGNGIRILTNGEGFNRNDFWVGVNEQMGERIFRGIDQWIRIKMATEGACTDD